MSTSPTVAIIAPGNMGAGVGRRLGTDARAGAVIAAAVASHLPA